MMSMKLPAFLFAITFSLMHSVPVMAHAFPDHAVPGAGATLAQAPTVVTIYFDSELEPLFSTLIVKDEQGTQVSKGKGQVDDHNLMMLSTRLTNLRRGIYHVYWSVVARDGHHTEGDYTFTLQ